MLIPGRALRAVDAKCFDSLAIKIKDPNRLMVFGAHEHGWGLGLENQRACPCKSIQIASDDFAALHHKFNSL